MANLNVTYDQMQSAATRLRNGQQDLESKLNELRSLVQQLVQNGFTTSRASAPSTPPTRSSPRVRPARFGESTAWPTT